jgi:hypothetical protein
VKEQSALQSIACADAMQKHFAPISETVADAAEVDDEIRALFAALES